MKEPVCKYWICPFMKTMHIGLIVFMEIMPINFIVSYVVSGMYFIRWYEHNVLIIRISSTRYEVPKFVSKLVQNDSGALHRIIKKIRIILW